MNSDTSYVSANAPDVPAESLNAAVPMAAILIRISRSPGSPAPLRWTRSTSDLA